MYHGMTGVNNLLFRLKYRRSRDVPAGISDEVRSFVELNYVPWVIAEEATADLFDVREIDQGIEEYSVYSAPEKLSSGTPRIIEDEECEGARTFSIYDDRAAESLDDVIASLGLTFQEKLLKMIDIKGFTDSEVYKRANLDRKHFSKIRCNVNYKPSKSTALALAISLRLNLDEATDLIGHAGLAFSPSSKQDLIVKYCIMNGIYDIYDVNALLYEYDQPLLGS